MSGWLKFAPEIEYNIWKSTKKWKQNVITSLFTINYKYIVNMISAYINILVSYLYLRNDLTFMLLRWPAFFLL